MNANTPIAAELRIEDIRDDDPEVLALVRQFAQSTYSLSDLYGDPLGATKTWEAAMVGDLVTFSVGRRRKVTSTNRARWIVLLQRRSDTRQDGAERSQRQRELAAKRRKFTAEPAAA